MTDSHDEAVTDPGASDDDDAGERSAEVDGSGTEVLGTVEIA